MLHLAKDGMTAFFVFRKKYDIILIERELIKLTNESYDRWKFVAQIILPGLGTLYFALAQIWGLPYAEQVVGTITAIDAFLGAILGISSAAYKKEN